MKAKLSVTLAMAVLLMLTAACGGHRATAPAVYGTVVGIYTGGPSGGDALSEAIYLVPRGTISLTGEGRAYSATVTDGLFKLKVLPGKYTVIGAFSSVGSNVLAARRRSTPAEM